MYNANMPGALYWQLRVPPPPSQYLQSLSDIRTDDRDIPSELANRDKEIPKQDKQTVKLNDESRQRPAEEDQENSSNEGDGPFYLLAAGEEGDCFVEADDKTQTDEKEDLIEVSIRSLPGIKNRLIRFPWRVYKQSQC